VRRDLLLMAAVLSLAFAPAPFPRRDKATEDLTRLQGAWVLVYSVKNGVREYQVREAVWLIEGNRISTTLDGQKGATFFIALDAKRTPRALDILSSREKAEPVPGRYSVVGDTLKVCLGEKGGKRPADLSGDGTSSGVWVFQRKKR
jgi:uncharacterized protein (TIGR03067 family)